MIPLAAAAFGLLAPQLMADIARTHPTSTVAATEQRAAREPRRPRVTTKRTWHLPRQWSPAEVAAMTRENGVGRPPAVTLARRAKSGAIPGWTA